MTGDSIDLIFFVTTLRIANFHLDCGVATFVLESEFICSLLIWILFLYILT